MPWVGRACRRPPIIEITFLCVDLYENTHWNSESYRWNFDAFDSWAGWRRM